jgi:hypothetical protein
MSSSRRTRTTFQCFIESVEASGGLLLMASAALGLAMANSLFAQDYKAMMHAPIGGLDLLHWINDGLMTFFFLLVRLEIKREMVEGQLDTWPRRALPLIAAFGGMFAPAVIFMAINFAHPENWRGWAVPTATDIAFALGVLALVGSRVPSSLKVFLTSLAIIAARSSSSRPSMLPISPSRRLPSRRCWLPRSIGLTGVGRHGFSLMSCSAFCCGPRCCSQAFTQRSRVWCWP